MIALTRFGEELSQTGAFNESLKVYLEAITIMEQLVRGHPEKVDWQQQLAVCYEVAGIVSGHPMYINMGDRPAAANWFEKMLAIFQQLSDADSSDMRSQFELSEALASLASAIRESDPTRAERLYHRSLVLNEAIVQSKPDDALAPRWQAFNRMGLAWVLSRKQQHAEAIQELEKALALQQSSLARENRRTHNSKRSSAYFYALSAQSTD